MADLTWPEIEQAAKDNTPVLFPIGVIEEHGPHLPLGTDTYLAYQLARLVKQELETRDRAIFIMPPYYWGINVSTGSFPGSFTVQPETMRAVLHDTFRCLLQWNFKQVFTLNLHGDRTHGQTLLEAVQAARNDLGLDVRNILDRYTLRRLGLADTEPYLIVQEVPPIDYADTHAGGSETGQFAAFYPHLANLDLARQLPPQNDGFMPRGYWGDPPRYDVEASRRFSAAYARLTADAVAGALKS
jgi:creatinine amidohydrolase